MNKRAAPRFPVTLDVTVTFPGNAVQHCTLRDYCATGMYLLCGDVATNVSPNDLVWIEFSHPRQSQGTHLRLEARVARTADTGVGVAFCERYPAALAALAQMAQSQSASARQALVCGEDMSELIGRCRAITDEHLMQFVQALFSAVNASLLNANSTAKGDKRYVASFSVANELRKEQPAMVSRFIERVDGQYAILSTPGYHGGFSQAPAGQGELALVDTQELDNWLAVRSVAARLEESLGVTLEALACRFEKISANPINLENNPVGPFSVVSAFREAVAQLALDDEVKEVIISTMGELLQNHLKVLYAELNKLLIAAGIVPEIVRKTEVLNKPAKAPQGEPTREVTTAGDKPAASTGARAPAYTNVTSPSLAGSRTNAALDIREEGAVSAAVQPGEPVLAPMPYARPSNARENAEAGGEATYQRVQELMRLQQEIVPETGHRTDRTAGYYSGEALMQAFGSLQALAPAERERVASLGHANYLQQKIGEMLGEEGKSLSENHRETVTYVGGLFNSIWQDELIAPEAKPWFGKLEIPLLQAGLLDASLLQDDLHPARQLLNRLERLGDRLQGNDAQLASHARERIEAILDAIPSRVAHDPGVFAEALGEVEGIEETVEKVYEENIAQLIQPCKKEHKLNRARRAILIALNQRLGQREVAEVVLELLESGWKNLLLRTYLKDGEESDVYRHYLDIIDQLQARLMEAQPYSNSTMMPDETLLESIGHTLSTLSDNEERNRQLLGVIGDQLRGEAGGQVETRYVPELKLNRVRKARRAGTMRPPAMDEEEWQLMLLDLGELQSGESFGYTDEKRGKLQAKLVWQDADESRYVFADNSGNKLLDLDLDELATLLHSQLLSRLEQKSLSVTERATYQFLTSLHNKLAHQAQHDELTGLLNRKAFQRKLEEVVISARGGNTTHVLCYLDIDRFNIINSTCGHAEGDVLLVTIARLLEEKLGDNVAIGRLGGDEFGILFNDCGRTMGLKLATGIHEAIRDLRFRWENNEFKITASIGMAEINEYTESSSRLLAAVDAAAFTAKDMGRDNIQIHNAENERISNRRTILDWVGRINVLFDKNLIQLRCQKIQPVHKTLHALPHYEVLLDVQDEEGNKVPLEEFIVAAERYNRINDIDTWVVDNVLDWMKLHKDHLDRISSLAINLSGSSVGNRKFMEHVESKLTRPGFPANKVCFEVTETTAINNLDMAARFMKKLKQTGCQFSLDDFGSGAASYSYLKSLPVDYLKIDGSFVKDIAHNTNDYAVVKSINEIGHAMGKVTVAEFVENEFSYQALSRIGIDYVQGFGVEKPIPLYKLFG